MRIWLVIPLTLIWVAAVLAAWVWVSLLPPGPLRPAATSFVLPDVTLVNPGRDRTAHAFVHVSQGTLGRIEYGSPGAPEAELLDRYRGHYVLPGLVDLHAHLFPDNVLALPAYGAFLCLAHGVTSVRDVGDFDATAVSAARQGIASGAFPGPRVFACGPFVGGDPRVWENTLVVRGPASAAAAVRRVKQQGFDCVKAYEGLDLEELRALLRAAHEEDLPVVGHVPAGVAYEDARIPEVQHFLGVVPPETFDADDQFSRWHGWRAVDDARMDRIVEATLESGIANTPTLVSFLKLLHYADYEGALADPTIRLMPRFYTEVVWSPRHGLPFLRELSPERLALLYDALERKRELLARLYQAGGELRIGTDLQVPFVVPGASLHDEMRLFAEVGIPAEEVWAIATRKAGEALRQPGLGTLRPGAPADLLVFREDPTADLGRLGDFEAVVAQGRLYAREDIEALQQAWLDHFRGFVFDRLSVTVARRIMAGLEPEGS